MPKFGTAWHMPQQAQDMYRRMALHYFRDFTGPARFMRIQHFRLGLTLQNAGLTPNACNNPTLEYSTQLDGTLLPNHM